MATLKRHDDMSPYFSGEKLYGDAFSPEEITDWFNSEKEAYADLGSSDLKKYNYEYHEMNQMLGFSCIAATDLHSNALGLGSAYGDEFVPIAFRLESITIVEPSTKLIGRQIASIVPNYVFPNPDGSLPFQSNYFQLVTCFGVLHHIPNVSKVLGELVRVMNPGGYLLLREPIRTMGDWRQPRVGLTKNERGIPDGYFQTFFRNNELTVVKRTLCDSLFLYKLLCKFGVKKSSKWFLLLDIFVSKILERNIHYHPRSLIDKLSPGSVFYVIRKNA